MLIRILAPHFCAGIDYPRKYAPILSYMQGWKKSKIKEYCKKKNWEFLIIKEKI